MGAFVELSRLAVGFAGQDAPLLEDFSAALRTRELVCLMGPNGVGKSTLVRTLLGLQPPLRGSIALRGRALPALSRRYVARNVSAVLPGRAVAGHLRVEELVALGRLPYTAWSGRYRRADADRARQALAQVGAGALRRRRVAELSDGERQRVLIARALAQDTPLLLLDEPTAFLDIGNRIQVTRLLQRLAHAEGKAILMTTHDLDLALHHADRLWLWNAVRRRITMGAPEEMMLSGALPEAFAGADVRFDPATGALQRPQGQGRRVHVRDDSLASVWARRALQRKGFRIADAPDAAVPTVAYDASQAQWILINAAGQRAVFASLYYLLNALSETGSPGCMHRAGNAVGDK